MRWTNFKSDPRHPLLVTAFTIFGLGASKTTEMTSHATLEDLLQNADQLFDESKYQETLDVLNNFNVSSDRTDCDFVADLVQDSVWEDKGPI